MRGIFVLEEMTKRLFLAEAEVCMLPFLSRCREFVSRDAMEMLFGCCVLKNLKKYGC